MGRPALEVADIFRAHGSAWRQMQQGHLSLGQLKVMSAIEQCRSAAWAAMFCVAKLVSRSRSLTTHVAIGIARSVRRAPHGDGSRLDKPICYPSSITTWC